MVSRHQATRTHKRLAPRARRRAERDSIASVDRTLHRHNEKPPYFRRERRRPRRPKRHNNAFGYGFDLSDREELVLRRPLGNHFVVAGNVRGVTDGSQSPVQERSNVVPPMPDSNGGKHTLRNERLMKDASGILSFRTHRC